MNFPFRRRRKRVYVVPEVLMRKWESNKSGFLLVDGSTYYVKPGAYPEHVRNPPTMLRFWK